MSFSDNIKKWVAIDNEIKKFNIEFINKKNHRSLILNEIINYKNINNLDGKVIKYDSETLKFINSRQYQTITFNLIKTCLNELINDVEQVDYIISYIKEKRTYKNVEDIKRFYV